MKFTGLGLGMFPLMACLACGAQTEASSATSGSAGGSTSTSTTVTEASGGAAGAVTIGNSATDYVSECESFEVDSDYTWDEAGEVTVNLSDAGTTSDGEGVVVSGGAVTITAAGTYRLSGALSDGQVLVESASDGVVRLILDNASVHSNLNAALHVVSSERTVIGLVEGTTNTLSDSANYDAVTEANAALFCQSNCAIFGLGTLNVTGNYNDGITGKDGLVIRGGHLVVSAVDDGIRGKDCLVARGGEVQVTSGGDGLKSDNENDSSVGNVMVKDGTFDITSAGDGVSAQSGLYVSGGTLKIVAFGGAGQTVAEDASAKGLKAELGIVVDAGTITIDAADDAVHSAGAIWLNGGDLTLASADDGVHSDTFVGLAGATTNISQSYEGVEGLKITVSGGTTHIVSSDDGINASDGSGATANPSGVVPAMPGSTSSTPTSTSTTTATESSPLLLITGGTLVVNAAGDGLDSNGNLTMSGGTVLVAGPTDNGNGPLDIGDGGAFSLTVTGGMLLASGSAGMAIAPSATSTQAGFLATTQTATMGGPPGMTGSTESSGLAAGTCVSVRNAKGESLVTYCPPKSYESLVYTSPQLVAGSYVLSTFASCSGKLTDHLCSSGTDASSTERATFSLSTNSTVSTVAWTLD